MAVCVRRILFAALAAIAWGATAEAQTAAPSSAADAVKASVPAGGIVHVTDAGGRKISGRLAAVTTDTIRLDVGGRERRLAASDVRQVVWERPDSSWNGLLIGAGAGAIPGIYYLITDPNECTGMCPEEYALIAAGAAVGWLVDRAITRKVTVFRYSERGAVAIVPFGTPSRAGIQVALRF
jgi:hypothetical protein